MEYFTALPLGFLVGMSHAIEADHLAAISTLVNGPERRRNMFRRGAFWGIGHSASLLIVSIAVIYMGLTISDHFESALEFVVGLMIAALGARVLWRMRKEKVHIHVHEHDAARHLHFHAHKNDTDDHGSSTHDHRHVAIAKSGNGLVLAVGMMHGLAGSAAFMILMLATADTPGQAFAYLAVFALGSIIGMGALTAILSLPLGRIQRVGGWVPTAAKFAIGAVAIGIGGLLAVESLTVFLGLEI